MKEIKINNNQEIIYSFLTPTNMPVYMWVNKKKHNVHLTLNVKYGSAGTEFTCNNIKYTVPTGTAHFLEHLKFHLKDNDASNLFYDLGCDSNAYTSINETSYEVFANDNIYEAAKLLLNFVFDNYFTKNLVDNERKIILEECNSSKDDPEYMLYREEMLSYLVKSHHRNPVIGYEKDVKNISIDDVSLVHDFFYRPENMFMIVTGDFDPEKMMNIICDNEKERSFKDIGKISLVKEKEPKEFLKNNIIVENKNCFNIQGRYMIKVLEEDFKGYTKTDVLIALRSLINANFGTASDFYEEITQNNIVTRFGSSVSYDDGVFGLVFSFVSENPDLVFKLIEEKLQKVEITKEDLERIIKAYETQSIMRFDNIYGVSAYLIASIIDDGKISDIKYTTLKKLTPAKVMKIFNKIDLKNNMKAVLKPKK